MTVRVYSKVVHVTAIQNTSDAFPLTFLKSGESVMRGNVGDVVIVRDATELTSIGGGQRCVTVLRGQWLVREDTDLYVMNDSNFQATFLEGNRARL